MIKGWVCVVWLALVGPAQAGDVSGLYDDRLLRYWGSITPADIQAVYQRDIRRVLTVEERTRLEGLELLFPLRCADGRLEPFCYITHALPDGRPAISLSITSLRLFGDLALAIAWLQLQGYAIDTPVNYLTMLKYQEPDEFPGGRFPPPLDALGIPDDVRDDAEVMGLFGKIYTSAIVFVLLHELGHVLYGHAGYGPDVPRAQAQANEAAADAFALDVLARLAYPPLGMVYLFTLMAHWEPNRWNFDSEAAYQTHLNNATHPLTADRLRGLARSVVEKASDFARAEPDYAAALTRMHSVGAEIERLADFMEDRDVQEGIIRIGRATHLASLKPRQPGELPLQTPAESDNISFNGEFRGEMSDASGSLPVTVVLQRHGDQVVGQYSYGMGIGKIVGEIRDGQLYFGWQMGADRGSGKFVSDQGGDRISGTWGYGSSDDNGGRWEGWR